jgi:hypothetical protein
MALAGLILLTMGVLWWHGARHTPLPKGSVKVVDEQVINVMQGMLEDWKGTSQALPQGKARP